MNVGGFTLSSYHRLLETVVDDFESLTVAEHLRTGPSTQPYVVLRHDVDRWVDRALAMARLEAREGVQSTYYFRTTTFVPEIVEEVRALGHEVGYHYEDYTMAGGDTRRAHASFSDHLDAFREHVAVETVCAHGCPMSAYQNTDLWREGPSVDQYDLLGEAYLSIDTNPVSQDQPSYCSDTGREWTVTDPQHGDVETTDELIDFFATEAQSGFYLLAHPSRWTASWSGLATQLAWDVTAETGKKLVGAVEAYPVVERSVRRTASSLAGLGRFVLPGNEPVGAGPDGPRNDSDGERTQATSPTHIAD